MLRVAQLGSKGHKKPLYSCDAKGCVGRNEASVDTWVTANLTLDTKAPRITVLSYRNLSFRVSEPATLTLVVGTRRFTRTLTKPAATQFWLKVKPASYILTAADAAGNTSSVRYRR